MIEWLSWTQAAIAGAAGIFCLAAGLAGRKPDDWTVGAAALGWLWLLVDVVLGIVGPLMGNPCRGDGIEWWAYLVSALIIPPGVVLWGLVERTKWSTVMLGVAMLAVAVMMIRMQQIWAGVGPILG